MKKAAAPAPASALHFEQIAVKDIKKIAELAAPLKLSRLDAPARVASRKHK